MKACNKLTVWIVCVRPSPSADGTCDRKHSCSAADREDQPCRPSDSQFSWRGRSVGCVKLWQSRTVFL